MEEEIKKTGIIYCRVSSVEQVEGTSLESQERMCNEFAVRENIKILETFIEKGESAKTANRTEFNKAIIFCQKNKKKINYFIVYKLDRFARNQADHAVVRVKLKEFGTELKSVTEPIDDTPVGKAMEGMLSVFAEFDNNVRTERSVNGMLERIKQGIWVWQAPLGYYRPTKGSNLFIDKEKAPFIKTIFEEYAKGIYTYESLANLFNEQGFKTKYNKKIIPQLIEKILKNPLYCGIMRVWGKEYQGTFEPIIEQELFYNCQQSKKKRSRNGNPRTAKNPHFPLRGLAVCDECNFAFTGSKSTGRKGKKYSYYHHQKQECKKAVFIPSESFEQSFVEYLNVITPDEKYEKIFKEIVLDIWKTNYKKLDEENTKTRKDIEKLENDRQRVFDLHRSGVYSDEDFLHQKRIVNQNIDQKYRMLTTKRIEEFNMEDALSYCFNFVRDTSKKWFNFEYPEKVRFQKMIFEDNVWFDGEKFGNGELSPIYKMNQEYMGDKSQLVTLPGIEPELPA